MTSPRRRLTLLFAAAAAVAALAGTIVGPAAPATAAWTPQVERLSGSDRYQTALSISKKFPTDRPRVFIATGEAFPDALSASWLAGALDSPLLLVQKNTIPAGVVTEIKRLKPRTIVIAGGTGAVSRTVESQLAKLAPVDRVSGADRYETSRRMADYYPIWEDGAQFVATGRDFADALTAGPVAADNGAPVILVDGRRSSLDAATKTAMDQHDIYVSAIIGGTGAVSSGIERQLKGMMDPADVLRVSGADRYATAAKLNGLQFPEDYDVAYLAVGKNYADALAGGPLAAKKGPLFLVQSTCVPGVVLDSLNKAQPAKIVLLGGKGVLSDNVARLKRCA